jgi:hypothetical protein
MREGGDPDDSSRGEKCEYTKSKSQYQINPLRKECTIVHSFAKREFDSPSRGVHNCALIWPKSMHIPDPKLNR